MTYDELVKRMRDEINKPAPRYIEVYPLQWKKIPELREICEARIKNGIGVWSVPIEDDPNPPAGE